MTKNDETVTLDCEVVGESEKAYKIEVMVGKKIRSCWVAKSISEMDRKKTSIELPVWLAEKEKLV